MAAKKSTPESRSRRNLTRPPAASKFDFESLRPHIEQERSRLTDAEAVLDCVIYAMEEDERLDVPGPSYPNVVRIARSYVSSAIDRLDSVNIRAALEQGSGHVTSADDSGIQERVPRKCSGVKEAAVVYVH